MCQRHASDACLGATIMLPIANWKRRFIDMAQSDDAGQGGGEVEVGGGEEGGGASAGGSYGMMLMSSTHHRYAGFFTIRKLGARLVTQLCNAAPRARIASIARSLAVSLRSDSVASTIVICRPRVEQRSHVSSHRRATIVTLVACFACRLG